MAHNRVDGFASSRFFDRVNCADNRVERGPNQVNFYHNRVDSEHNQVGFFNRVGLSQSSRFLSQSSQFLSQLSRF